MSPGTMTEQFFEEIREPIRAMTRELLTIRRIPIRAITICMEALAGAKTSESAEASGLLRLFLRFKFHSTLRWLR